MNVFLSLRSVSILSWRNSNLRVPLSPWSVKLCLIPRPPLLETRFCVRTHKKRSTGVNSFFVRGLLAQIVCDRRGLSDKQIRTPVSYVTQFSLTNLTTVSTLNTSGVVGGLLLVRARLDARSIYSSLSHPPVVVLRNPTSSTGKTQKHGVWYVFCRTDETNASF
jgi:hypothetical protein